MDRLAEILFTWNLDPILSACIFQKFFTFSLLGTRAYTINFLIDRDFLICVGCDHLRSRNIFIGIYYTLSFILLSFLKISYFLM